MTVLLLLGVLFYLPLSRKWVRRSGYGSLVLGLLIGLVVYFNAGRLGDLRIGPIPKGTPVNLLANFNSEADLDTQVATLRTVLDGLAEIKSRHLDSDENKEELDDVMRKKIAPALMEVNKCPDFVMDHGLYFPWFDSMSDGNKDALIELLKTF